MLLSSLCRFLSLNQGNRKGRLFLLLVFFASFSLYAQENSNSKPIVFSIFEGKQWVEKCIAEYPEILWLADEKVHKTEEGRGVLQGSFSEQIFGRKFIEFDRTVMSIQCLKLILNGSDQAYKAFTQAQPKDFKLSKESFQKVHLQGKNLLKSKWEGLTENQMGQAMETALVLSDIGKSEKARELFKPYAIKAIDHDDFYEEAMYFIEKNPMLCPSFAKLSASAKKLIIKTAGLAHYGHITHLEGGVEMFNKLKESAVAFSDPIALSFNLFVHICDVAGALGHVNSQSSLSYTELTHKALQATADAVRILSNPKKTEIDAFNGYLEVRALWLGLNPKDPFDRVLTRIGAMLRLFTSEEGIILRKALLALDISDQNRIVAQLDVDASNSSEHTPTYMPAVLVNLLNNTQLGESNEIRLNKAIKIGVPFIALVLEKHKELLIDEKMNPNVALNFNKIAAVAKTSPNRLKEEFVIDKEGIVHLESN